MAETDAQAWADVEEPVTNYLQAAWIANSADSLEAEISRSDDGSIVYSTSVSPESRQALVERAMIIGNPETVAATLLEYEAVGVQHPTLWFVWGYNTPERVWRSFELFNQEVRPRLDEAVSTVVT